MQLILSPKDNLGKVVLKNVEAFALEGDTLLVVFACGRTRNYPLQHLWYYESHTDNHNVEWVIVEEEDDDSSVVLTGEAEDEC